MSEREMSDQAAGEQVTSDSPVVDPRAVRVTTALATRLDDDPVLTLGPGDVRLAGIRLERHGPGQAVLIEITPSAGGPTDGPAPLAVDGLSDIKSGGLTICRTRLLLGPERPATRSGAVVREIVVDGWRIEVELESDRRASLRDRASRGPAEAGTSGPSELRAIIPGRIVAVSVTVGDEVEAGQHVLVVEAMKMQNELRAPRAGRVERVPGAVGQTVEVGDLLLVIT
jgi:biotin carboxyl carrier protein